MDKRERQWCCSHVTVTLADTISSLTGVSLGSDYTVYTNCKVYLNDSKELCLEKVRYSRQDALDDPNVKWSDVTMPKRLESIDMSMEEYFTQIVERTGAHRPAAHHRGGESQLRPHQTQWPRLLQRNFDRIGSNSEDLGRNYGTLPNCIDNGWANEKASYSSTWRARNTGRQGITPPSSTT